MKGGESSTQGLDGGGTLKDEVGHIDFLQKGTQHESS